MPAQPAEAADVTLVVDFLNTLDVEDDTDVLRAAESWHGWASGRDLRPDELAVARQARDALRAEVGDPSFDRAELSSTVVVGLTRQGPALRAETAVAAVLAAAARLAVLDQWRRVKICPADDCRWAFYDKSRNRSRTWCSMQVCGNREKARTWRERTHQDQP